MKTQAEMRGCGHSHRCPEPPGAGGGRKAPRLEPLEGAEPHPEGSQTSELQSWKETDFCCFKSPGL